MFFLSDGLRGALSQRLRFLLLSLLDCFGQQAVIPMSPPGRSRLSRLPRKRAYLPGGLRCPPSLIIDSCYIFFIYFFTVRLRVTGHCGNDPDVRTRQADFLFFF